MKLSRTVALLSLGLIVTAAAEPKVLCINMDQVFRGYYKTVREDASLKNQEKTYENYARGLAQEAETLKKAREELLERSLNIALSEETRAENRRGAEEKERLYGEKVRELKEFMEKRKKELGERYLQVRRKLVEEMTVFIQNYAKSQGAEFVLDRSGMSSNMIPLVLYYPEDADITQAVLAELNRGHEDEVKDLPQKDN